MKNKNIILIVLGIFVFTVVLYFIVKEKNIKQIKKIEQSNIQAIKNQKATINLNKQAINHKLKNKIKPNDDNLINSDKNLNNYLQNNTNMYAPQEELPSDILEKIKNDINNKLDLGSVGDFSKSGLSKMGNNNLQDTISISELPPMIAEEAKKNLLFRDKNGFDKTSERNAQNIVNPIGQLSGTQFPIPKLNFELSILSDSFYNSYQYLGYIYPFQEEESTIYSSIKRIFNKISNNTILAIKETSLKNGSAVITTEFVNTNVQNCPATIVEKRSDSGAKYGQINWNTNLIGFTIYQIGEQKTTDGLLKIANNIATTNKEKYNCNSKKDDDLPKYKGVSVNYIFNYTNPFISQNYFF